MITTSDAWKNLIATDDLLPESDVNIVSNNDVHDPSNWEITLGGGVADIANEKAILSSPNTIRRNSSKIATLEWNFWILDGTYEVPTEETTIDGYVSVDATNAVGRFDLPVTNIQLNSDESIAKNFMTVKFAPDINEYATAWTLTNGSEMSYAYVDESNEYHYLAIPGSENNYLRLTVVEWSMPYRRIRINELLLGARLFFTKSNLSQFKHHRTGDMVNAELPQNDCDFSVLDVNGDFDSNNPRAKFAYLINTNTTFSLYYGYKINNSWEYHLIDAFYVETFQRPANGIEAKFSLESNLNRKNQTLSTNVNYTFDTYAGLVSYIQNVMGVTISYKGESINFASIPKLGLSQSVKSNPEFYKTPVNQMLQIVACILNCYLFRTEAGLFELRCIYTRFGDYINDTTILDTISLLNCFEYPEIETIANIGEIVLTLLKYPLDRPDESLDSEYTADIGGTSRTFPPVRFSQKYYNGGVSQTAENQFLSLGSDSEYTFTVNDGIHTSYMSWLNKFISGAKKVKVKMRINPAWQIGDIVAMQIKDGSYIKGFIVDIDIEYAGYPKGNVTILSPVQFQGE